MEKSFISSFTFSDYWKNHADVQLVQWIQARTREQAAGDEGSDFTSSEDKEEENSRTVPEADGNVAYEQESSSGPEDSESNSGLDVCNKFSVLGAGE